MAIKFRNLLIILIMAVMVGSPLLNIYQRAYAVFGFDAVVSEALTIARQAALESLKRRLLTMITDQIIGWIEGEGKPLFITDWKSFLARAVNTAVGDLAIDLDMGYLCSPFGFQVQLTVLRPPRFTEMISCTLEDIVANIENFYDDFRNGGWLAYAEIWQPQNNYYGSVLMAMQELERRSATERESNLFEALAGGGFVGTRMCDSSGRYCTITTPGAQIGALAAKAVGADIDYLINSQDLAVYVGAISDAFINRLIRSGAEGLISLTTPNKPEGGAIVNTGPCAGLKGDTLTNCLAVIKSQENNFVENQRIFLSQIDATLLPREASNNNLIQIVSKQTDLVNGLVLLRDCQASRSLPEAINTSTQLRDEQIILNRLDSELLANDQIIDLLLGARSNIENPSLQNTSSIVYQFDNVIPYLNADLAKEFRQSKEKQLIEINQKVNEQLPVIQQQLNQCLGI